MVTGFGGRNSPSSRLRRERGREVTESVRDRTGLCLRFDLKVSVSVDPSDGVLG